MIGCLRTGGLERGFEGSRLRKGIPCWSYTEGLRRMATIQGSNLSCAARERFGYTAVSSVRKLYLEEHRLEY